MEASESGLKRMLSRFSARTLGAVTLLATIPVALFALGRSLLAVIAFVNVLLIFGSLYLLTAPAEGEGHESADEESAESPV